MASTSWGLAAAGFGGGGGLAGFGAPAGGQQGGEPVETLLVGQTRVIVGPQMGEGGFAFVYACVDAMDPSRRYVLKKILIQDEQARLSAEKEIRLLRLLQPCPQVVRCIDAVILPGTTHNCQLEALILMENCSGGNLLDIIRARATMTAGGSRQQPMRFTREEILRVAEDVGRAIAALHHQRPPIAHRDLKLENVLLLTDDDDAAAGGGGGGDGNGESRYRLIDFGSCVEGGPVPLTNARERAEEEERVAKYTTQMYRAPEMVDLYMKRQLDEQVDVWALGCILFAFTHLVHPFQDAGNLGIINGKIRRVQVPPELEDVQQLIDRMLLPDPQARLTIDEVLEHVRCLQAHQPLPPRTRFTPDEERQQRQQSTAQPRTSLSRVGSSGGPSSSLFMAMAAAEAKPLDPSSAAARRLAARGGGGGGGAGPVAPPPPPPKPPTPSSRAQRGGGSSGGRGGGPADTVFFSTDDDAVDGLLAGTGTIAAAAAAAGEEEEALPLQFGTLDPFAAPAAPTAAAAPVAPSIPSVTMVRPPSFDQDTTPTVLVKPPSPVTTRQQQQQQQSWASFSSPLSPSPVPTTTTSRSPTATEAFDPYPASPGGQQRRQASPTVLSSPGDTSGLLRDWMAQPVAAPPPPTVLSGQSGMGSVPGDPRFMATMLAGTAPAVRPLAVGPPPKPPKPASRLSPPQQQQQQQQQQQRSPFPASGDDLTDPFRSLLDPTPLQQQPPQQSAPAARPVPPPKPPMISTTGGGMGMGRTGVAVAGPLSPSLSPSPYMQPPSPQQAQGVVDGYGFYPGTLYSSVGAGHTGAMSSSPKGAGAWVPPPPPPPQPQPQPQQSFGYGSASGGVGINSGGFGSLTGPTSPLAASAINKPGSPHQQQLQQSISQSHSSFYEEADPFYQQTQPVATTTIVTMDNSTTTMAASSLQRPRSAEEQQPPALLDPYGFPTPPRPGKGKGAASPVPQQWPGTPF